MSANKANKSFLFSIIEFHHQPVLITGNVKKLVIFHHDPVHNDEFVDDMIVAAKKIAEIAESNLEIIGAKEGLKIELI